MYYVYILQSKSDSRLYIGYTSDLKKRFIEHNSGKSTYTKTRGPWSLIYYEAFKSRKDAKNREVYLKSGWGFRSIKILLKDYLS